MFDLGWMELLVIGVVALIVVGPKDLPIMFKTVGNFRFALHECLLLQSLGEQTPSEGMLCVGHMPEQIISNPLNV